MSNPYDNPFGGQSGNSSNGGDRGQGPAYGYGRNQGYGQGYGGDVPGDPYGRYGQEVQGDPYGRYGQDAAASGQQPHGGQPHDQQAQGRPGYGAQDAGSASPDALFAQPAYDQQAYAQPGQEQFYAPQSYGQMQAHGYQPVPAYGPDGLPRPPKSKVAAALFAFFFGMLGVHNFYLGYTSRATTQLVLTLVGGVLMLLLIGFLVVFAVGIWVFVEFIMILTSSGGYDRDADGYPLV